LTLTIKLVEIRIPAWLEPTVNDSVLLWRFGDDLEVTLAE
jgi:hypothetical protein